MFLHGATLEPARTQGSFLGDFYPDKLVLTKSAAVEAFSEIEEWEDDNFIAFVSKKKKLDPELVKYALVCLRVDNTIHYTVEDTLKLTK